MAMFDEPAKPPVTFRKFDDIEGQRQDIYDMAAKSVASFKPLENAQHRLEFSNVGYDNEYEPGIADEKDAVLRRKSLQRALKADVSLKDPSGKIVDQQRMTVAHVPHLNSQGLFVRNGIQYAIRNQLRLRPGIYTRERSNGGIETHFNVKPGTGRGFRVELEPESGLFKFVVGQSTTKLYPVLKSLGISDDAMKAAWGDELFEKNYRAPGGRDDMDISKLVHKLSHVKGEVPNKDLSEVLRAALHRSEVDEDTTELTMGNRIKNVTPETILGATQKQLRVARKEIPSDNRDSQAYQSFHNPQSLIAERLSRDITGSLRQAFWRASRKGSLQPIQPGMLNKNIGTVFEGSGLAQTPENINPLEIHDLRQAITRMGEGGIRGIESVSREARNVQASYLGVIDANRAPESSSIGVDLRATDSALQGSDGQLYTTVKNLKTGQLETISARDLSTKTVAFPGEMNSPNKRVAVTRNDKVTHAPKEEIDYEIVNPDDLMSRGMRVVPFPEGVKGQRALMGARMSMQAVPLREPEAPFVQTADTNGSSLHRSMGKSMGAQYAPEEGVVIKVEPDSIILSTPGGKKKVDLYNNYFLGRKTALHNTPVVQVGMPVRKGDILAKSNFTDDNGTMSIGRNLRSAYMSDHGNTIEDAFVISEDAAKKLGAEAMYKHELSSTGLKSTDKGDYRAVYGDKFKPEQFDKIGDDGIIKVGSTVNTGDPLVLGIGDKPQSAIGALMTSPKSAISDKAEIWEHHAPGVVTDVERTKDGIKVLVKSYDTAQIGSKLAPRFGNKGVISSIKPTDQMPIASDGKPIEVIFNTNGLVSRVNPSTLAEQLLGKIVERTGREPYIAKAFNTPEGIADFALNEAKKYGIPETETVVDPRDGRAIPNVFVGNSYIMALQHKAEGKLSARDQGAYTTSGYPAKGGPEGAKKINLMDSGVLLAAGATNFLKDVKLIRGQRNDDYWRQVRHGETPIAPTKSFADDEFKDMLKGAGVHIHEHGTTEQLKPLLDKDVDALARHEVKNGETYNFDTMDPVEGGLFDVGTTGGAEGKDWTKITLPEKIPHPLFIDPIQKILGLTGKEMNDVLSGKEELYGKRGPEAIEKALSGIDIDRSMEIAKNDIRGGKASKRDDAVKRLQYLQGLKTLGVKPDELMVSKIAVVPPRYRPVVRGESTDMIHDLNYLYHDLLEAKKNYGDAKTEFGSAGDQYLTMLNAVKAISGKESPVNPKTAEQGVKGILNYAIGLGSSPKYSTYHRRVIGSSVDTVGRTVITADGNLGMDEIGLPEKMAWSIFRPFVIRRLVQNGKPPAEAMTDIQQQTPEAKMALEAEMAHRPIVYNRAPALHRYAYQGAMAKLVPGDALHVPYHTLKVQQADFDGDQDNIHVPVSDDAIEDVKEKMMPSKNLHFTGNFETHYEPVQDYTAGLYLAGKKDDKQPVKVFLTADDAKSAYARGEITAQTPIRVLHR